MFQKTTPNKGVRHEKQAKNQLHHEVLLYDDALRLHGHVRCGQCATGPYEFPTQFRAPHLKT